jgi:putative flippase GtrA
MPDMRNQAHDGTISWNSPNSWLAILTKHIPPGQFGRYLVVGAVNTLFGYGSFAALTSILNPFVPHSYIIAAGVSGLLNITFSYLTYKWFVFRTKGDYLREWSRCVAVYSSWIILGMLLLPLLVVLIRHETRFSTAAPYIAGAVLMGIGVLYSFLGHRKFSFRPPR